MSSGGDFSSQLHLSDDSLDENRFPTSRVGGLSKSQCKAFPLSSPSVQSASHASRGKGEKTIETLSLCGHRRFDHSWLQCSSPPRLCGHAGLSAQFPLSARKDCQLRKKRGNQRGFTVLYDLFSLLSIRSQAGGSDYALYWRKRSAPCLFENASISPPKRHSPIFAPLRPSSEPADWHDPPRKPQSPVPSQSVQPLPSLSACRSSGI